LASQEEEETEGIRAVGMRILRKTTIDFLLFWGGNLVWCFPMPLIPIVLTPSFLFLLACVMILRKKTRDIHRKVLDHLSATDSTSYWYECIMATRNLNNIALRRTEYVLGSKL
jgi:hypothetical protein